MTSYFVCVPHKIPKMFLCCRYDPRTGVFTVPIGEAGLYYFSTVINVDWTEYATFDITANGHVICFAHKADDDSAPAASFGEIELQDGKKYLVL